MYQNQDDVDEVVKARGLPFCVRYTKELRILLVVVFCGIIAVAIPFTVNRYGFHLTVETQSGEEGSCRVSTGFKMDCLPDFSALSLITATAKTRCVQRGCCWDNSTVQSITCFYRLPAYQYSSKLNTISADTMSGELEVSSVLGSGDSSTTKFKISSDKKGHVVIDIGVEDEGLANDGDDFDPVNIIVGCPGFSGTYQNPSEKCVDHEIFTIELRPPSNTSGSSYARTHFGPIMMSEALSEISFYLPSPRVFGYGMEQFIWSGKKEVSYFNFGSTSDVHLPMIIGMHPNQDWFMLWLETGYPGEQIISMGSELRPILSWRTMGGPMKIHFITAPTVTSLLEMGKAANQADVPIPPYWTLGYHMCRSVGDPRSFTNDINGMTAESIPFDLDCIDEQMIQTAFDLNVKAFPALSNNFLLLSDNNKDVLLPLVIQRSSDIPGSVDGCVGISMADNTCFEGRLYGESVIFPDPLMDGWMEQSMLDLETQLSEQGLSDTIVGWQLHNSWPSNDLTQGCNTTRFTPRGMRLDHSLCHDHWIQSVNSSFISQHSKYSLEISKSLHQLRSQTYQFGGVHQVGQAIAGGFLGSSVPATWEGMATSLREILMLGLAGQSQVAMPVCGTSSSKDQEDVGLLCLRWFQLGSYMASLRSWYSDTDNTRMPYQLAKTYQNYITWSLEKRYKMLPYLRTFQMEWVTTGTPLVRPMFLEFPSSEFFGLWEQFMVGPDLLVAPILSEDQELVSVHLPQGTWYDFNSGSKYVSPSDRNILQVKTKLYQIPAFQRGGSAIILYDSTTGMQTAKSATTTANLEVNIGLDCSSSPRVQKSLSSCTASSSVPFYLNTQDSPTAPRASVNVESLGNKGTITLSVTGDTTPLNKTLSLVYISGLSLPSTPTISLPGGTVSVICSADTTEPCLSWQPEQQFLMIKNVGIILAADCVGACHIGWTV